LNKLVKKKNYAKEKQDMWKVNRWLAVIAVAIMLAVASSGAVAAGTPWAHCHYSDPYDNLQWVEQEAWEVADILEPTYAAARLYNRSKSWQINVSLPMVDLWHFAGHGGTDWHGNSFLVAGDGAYLYGDEIPDLHDQHEFDCMRFAFGNACYSGCDDGEYDIYDGFIDNGCEAYLGWTGSVGDYDAYVWATTFYHYAVECRMAIYLARIITDIMTDMPDTPPNTTSVLYGDGYMQL
jgi:hypothetical protein